MRYSLAAHKSCRQIEGVKGTTDEEAHRLEGYKRAIIAKTERDLESNNHMENCLHLSIKQT
jgi:hypothetical protein